ncbi:MAG: response regulator [Rhodobacterales bacterium]|nr:response regulator [Rhodobacterales bacterium]
MFTAHANPIQRMFAALNNLAADFLGPDLLKCKPETQRVLRSTVIACLAMSGMGILFVGIWAYLGDPRSGMLALSLVIFWIGLGVLRQTLWPELMGGIFGSLCLMYWLSDAMVFDHLGPATYAGLYLAPVAAFQFGSVRMGRLFGFLAAVVTVALSFGGANGVLKIAEVDPDVLVVDRVGLLVLMGCFTTVVIYEQRFLDKILDQASQSLSMQVHRLGLVNTEAIGQQAMDLRETLASVAHDLSNPLTYAMANLELLRMVDEEDEDEDEEEPIVLMRDAYEGLARMANIVRDLGNRHQQSSVVSIEEVIQSAIRSTRADLEVCAKLVVQVPDELVEVRGVSYRLVQVLVNLLTNAVHAIPPGQPEQHEIGIRTKLTRDRVWIIVSDTGHGIPAAIRDRVLEPFFTTKSSQDGTGLGLAICARIAEEHGGRLRFSSGRDVGTEVTLSLPRLSDRTPDTDARSAENTRHAQMAHMNVLVIDDDPGMLKLVQRALRPMRVTVLQDGRKAAELCSEQNFDVIVCDIMMPNKGGREVYTEVVAQLPGLSERFLFLTGGAFSTGGAEFVARMPERVLQKPTTMGVLRQRIVQVDKRANSLQAPKAPKENN